LLRRNKIFDIRCIFVPQRQQQQELAQQNPIRETHAERMAKYDTYIKEELFNGTKDKVVNPDEASTSSAGALKKEGGRECGICFEEFEYGEKIKRLPCNQNVNLFNKYVVTPVCSLLLQLHRAIN
jgi:hypothetical protein